MPCGGRKELVFLTGNRKRLFQFEKHRWSPVLIVACLDYNRFAWLRASGSNQVPRVCEYEFHFLFMWFVMAVHHFISSTFLDFHGRAGGPHFKALSRNVGIPLRSTVRALPALDYQHADRGEAIPSFRAFSLHHLHLLPSFLQSRQQTGSDAVVNALENARVGFHFRVYGFVVMLEHVHLLISEPERADLPPGF
jgi:hypothetical protein